MIMKVIMITETKIIGTGKTVRVFPMAPSVCFLLYIFHTMYFIDFFLKKGRGFRDS